MCRTFCLTFVLLKPVVIYFIFVIKKQFWTLKKLTKGDGGGGHYLMKLFHRKSYFANDGIP